VADLKFPKVGHPEERAAAANPKTNGALRNVLEETERQQILRALKHCNWVVAGPNGAAAGLGMNRSTLQVRIPKPGISSSSAIIVRFHFLLQLLLPKRLPLLTPLFSGAKKLAVR
jgi:DNA-binding NtrC family response regulator